MSSADLTMFPRSCPAASRLPLLLPLLLLSGGAADAAILLPPASPGVNDAALVIVQGADVYPEQYRELG